MRLHCLVSRAADLVDRPAVAAHRFHFIGKPAQRLVIGVDVERDAAIKPRNRIVPCGCPCPVSDMLERDISLRSGEEYLRSRICEKSSDMSISQLEMPDERSEAAVALHRFLCCGKPL